MAETSTLQMQWSVIFHLLMSDLKYVLRNRWWIYESSYEPFFYFKQNKIWRKSTGKTAEYINVKNTFIEFILSGVTEKPMDESTLI